jgi:Flp pilus assembly protein TadG
MCLRPVTLESKHRRFFSRVLSNQSGAEIVEMALLLPALLSLVVGIFWLARAFNTYQTITRAAREGARYMAAPFCASCTNANTLPTATQARSVVNGALTAGSLKTSDVKSYDPTCPTGATCDCPIASVCVKTGIPLNTATGNEPTETGVSVSMGYPVSFPIPFVNISPITVNTEVRMRQENQ